MVAEELGRPVGRFALTNGRLLMPSEILTGKAVVIHRGRIAEIMNEQSLSQIDVVDVGGRYIAPGLIDIHIHGAATSTFNQPSALAFGCVTREAARHGVTSVLATLVSAPADAMVACLEFAQRWMQEPQDGSQVLGVNLEGPYLSRHEMGAQDPRSIRSAVDGIADILLKYHEAIKVMTLAPELPGALDLISKLVRLGIVPAAGHSACRDTDLIAAQRAGLRHVTHLWSGQSSTVREGPWRKPGLLEASLTLDGITAEMIADNRHLPATLMKLAYKCLGSERLCIVSDATAGAGMPEGSMFRLGEIDCEVRDGVGMTLDHTSFAGSVTLLNEMIRVLVRVVGIPITDAVRMATLTPAMVLGLHRRKGSLHKGKDADMTIFDDNFVPWRTMIGGRWVYASEASEAA